ncbi:MAG: DUF2239 family protein [Chlorobiaceae bacterium]|nr:DUF2239 family protein [Chlorobiaceae bacterium]
MNRQNIQYFTAFDGSRCIAEGGLVEVIIKVKEKIDIGEALSVLIFDGISSDLVEVDFRGTKEDVLKSLGNSTALENNQETIYRGPGRPKLGVIPREVTLLPRHWEWLNSQPGGASVALRKLVEEARRMNSDRDQLRTAQEAVYRFMSAMAGDLPGFEEAARALFAVTSEKFNEIVTTWPDDIRKHVQQLSGSIFNKKPSVVEGHFVE